MKFSLALPTCYEGLGYPLGFAGDGTGFIRLVRAAEAFGYDGIWGNDHLVTPHCLRAAGGSAPSFYDTLIVLAHVAAATTSLRLGTAVLALPLRHPVVLAKQAITLDVLSGGRLSLGLGVGAYPEEFAALHPDGERAARGLVFDERLEALRMLLDLGRGSYRGRSIAFTDVDLFPRPAQSPLPIYVGGHTARVIERAARWGQGWMPGWQPVAGLRKGTALLRARLSELERAPGSVEVAPELSATIGRRHEDAVARYEASGFVRHRRSRDRTDRDPALMVASNLVGSPDAILERVAALAEAGVEHCASIAFPAETIDELLEQWQQFSEEVIARATT